MKLTATILLLQFLEINVFALQCRHAVLKRYLHPRESLEKREGTITCENENQECARIHVEGLFDSHSVSMHAASCVERHLCKEKCPLQRLQNISGEHQLSEITACRIKCCRHDMCNTHITEQQKVTEPSEKFVRPDKPLRCYSGVKAQYLDGYMITDAVEAQKCFFSSDGDSSELESRCLMGTLVSISSEDSEPFSTTFAHCARTEMCVPNDEWCDEMKAYLKGQNENVVTYKCNYTCCSTPMCNEPNMADISSPQLYFFVMLAAFSLALHNISL